jgi:hypothetical protein
MTFREWFEAQWRQPGESETRAIYRLCIETGCGHPSVKRAIRGERLSDRVALRLVAPCGGAVDPSHLVFPDATA